MSKLHQSIRSAIVSTCLAAGVDSPNDIKIAVAESMKGVGVSSVAGFKAHLCRQGVAYKVTDKTTGKSSLRRAPRKEPSGTCVY